MAVPKLSLDRPFTYLLPDELEAGTGSLVSVPFHGRTMKGWILGPPHDVPEGRLLPVRNVRSPVRFFDPEMLLLLRWMTERYIAPLSTVIERSHPPRVASEEGQAQSPGAAARSRRGTPAGAERSEHPRGWRRQQRPHRPLAPVLDRYGRIDALLEPGVTTWLRPLPHDEVDVCIAAVEACLRSQRTAIVLVPEAEPVPATAAAVLEAFGDRAAWFAGGDDRERYRTWLQIQRGAFDVVVGTRPAVFAPMRALGLVWVSREVHPGHRDERSPYHHVREVAMARAGLHGAACVLASLSPSVDTATGVQAGAIRSARADRQLERASSPLVETTPPEAEDRSSRLSSLLKQARSATLIVSRRGYGIARVCRSCGEPATCATCRGPIVVERGRATCRVCGRPGECAVCHNRTFGIERGGTERIAEWAAQATRLRVELDVADGSHPSPGPGRLVVGTAATVKDVGPREVDLVAILDPDRALMRPGIHAGEQAVATWMEAAAWAESRGAGGRVLAQTRRPGHPAIQALVRWEPVAFLLWEADQRRDAGFPPNQPVFRIEGLAGLEDRLQEAGATVILATPSDEHALCLVTVLPERLPSFRARMVALANDGTVTRVEAEPQL